MVDVYFNNEFDTIHTNVEELPFFYHIKHKTEPLHIISIRGTEDNAEIVQGLSLFVESGIFQALSIKLLSVFQIHL